MLCFQFEQFASYVRKTLHIGISVGLFLALTASAALLTYAQDQPSGAQSQPSGQQTQPPPEAGGPQGDIGPYAIPKKKEEPPPPPPTKPKKIEGMGDYSIQVSVPLVEVPVMVTTKDGQFISNLKQDNFKVFEDGVEQKVSNFSISQAPITAVLLIEYASTNYFFMMDALRASYSFANSLKKDDWVAVEYYDLRPHILVDFTQDKSAIMGAIDLLRMPGFAETNLFDALFDTVDRLDRVEGHKYIILVSTGFDSFSKIRLDQITKKVRDTKNITIFSVSIGWVLREWCETNPAANACLTMMRGGIPVSQIDYLQADNEMQTFARLSGGRFYQPRFAAEYPEIFQSIAGDIRNQYTLAYHPTNQKLDGSYRKLKVEVVAPEGGPLKVHDQKGKDVKYMIIAREGYTAKHEVE